MTAQPANPPPVNPDPAAASDGHRAAGHHRDRDHRAGGRRPLVDPVHPQVDRATTDGLLIATGRGDLGAFAAFYDQTAAIVFGLLRGVLGDAGAAEQVTQRVYLTLWRAAPRFDPAGRSAYALLLGTARREIVDRVGDLLTHRGAVRRSGGPSAASGG